MATQDIQVGFGKANFPTASISIAGFVVEEGFTRTLISKKLGKVGRTTMMPVSNHPQIDGYLYGERVSVPEDTVLLFQTSTKQGVVSVSDGGIFIRVRKDAAALLITASIPRHARCTLDNHNHTVFSGRGDILTVEDLAEVGIDVPQKYAYAYMNPEEVAETYTITEIAPAITVKPKAEVHVADDGRKVTLKVEAPARRMRIRR